MVKTSGPLMSLEAQGSIGKVITYKKGKNGSVARSYNKPHNKISGAQWAQRHLIGMITAHWQVMTDNEKAPYISSAKLEATPMTGFNYFVKVANADLETHLGLRMYLHMNEKGGDTLGDISGNNNNGTLGPSYPSDVPIRTEALNEKYGKALSFDGSNNNVSINPLLVNMADDAVGSIGIWINVDEDIGQDNNILSFSRNGDAASIWFLIRLQMTEDNIFAWMRIDGVSYWLAKTDNNSIDAHIGKWLHVFLVQDGISPVFYINGKLVNTSFSVSTDKTAWIQRLMISGAPPDTVNLGMHKADGVETSPFKGKMDEVVIFNRALGAEEVMKHYELLRLNKKRQPSLSH